MRVTLAKKGALFGAVWVGNAHVRIGGTRGNTSPRCAIQKAHLEQVRLHHIHNGVRFFANARCQRFKANGTALAGNDEVSIVID